MTLFELLLPAFVASLILTGIHAYLGVHVVERGVIFVDLSLAQIAALGATIAMLMPFSGGDPHGHRGGVDSESGPRAAGPTELPLPVERKAVGAHQRRRQRRWGTDAAGV